MKGHRAGDAERSGAWPKLALLLHGITMTGSDSMVLWQPEPYGVIWRCRPCGEGDQCRFSIDTGATVYVNTNRKDAGAVGKIAAGWRDPLPVGGPAALVRHLFQRCQSIYPTFLSLASWTSSASGA